MSLRMEKQNVHGTGAPDGFSSTQCEYTDCVVFSNAWFAKFSQYSTTDWFSNSYTHAQRRHRRQQVCARGDGEARGGSD